jgi:hypothetical protein
MLLSFVVLFLFLPAFLPSFKLNQQSPQAQRNKYVIGNSCPNPHTASNGRQIRHSRAAAF